MARLVQAAAALAALAAAVRPEDRQLRFEADRGDRALRGDRAAADADAEGGASAEEGAEEAAEAGAGAPVDRSRTAVFFGNGDYAVMYTRASERSRYFSVGSSNTLSVTADVLDRNGGRPHGIPDLPALPSCDTLFPDSSGSRDPRPNLPEAGEWCVIAATLVNAGLTSSWQLDPIFVSNKDLDLTHPERNLPRYSATQIVSVVGAAGARWGRDEAKVAPRLGALDSQLQSLHLSSEWPSVTDRTAAPGDVAWNPNSPVGHRYSNGGAAGAPLQLAAFTGPWPRQGASANSRGHLVASSMGFRGTASVMQSGATFSFRNVVPTYQNFDGVTWGAFENAVKNLRTECWDPLVGGVTARVYYQAGPGPAMLGWLANEQQTGVATTYANLVGWPTELWGVATVIVSTANPRANRATNVAWICQNRPVILHALATVHPCRFLTVTALAAHIGFDPLPGEATKNNANPAALLPVVGDCGNHAGCQAFFGAIAPATLPAKCRAGNAAALFTIPASVVGTAYTVAN